MLTGLEPVIERERPEAVLVYGDTNSTLAGALAGARAGLPVAHVEAGLRSFDRRMPEETNRVVADHLSSWLFAPTGAAVANLAAEGITDGVELVGDLMRDLAARIAPEVRDPAALRDVPGVDRPLAPGGYHFATIHRAGNREPDAIRAWAGLLRGVARPDRPVVLALHPGTLVALEASREDLGPDVLITGPLGYRASLTLQLHAAAVLTDSGGVQREAGWLGVPCLVLRDTTEWGELLADSGGRMSLVGLDSARATAELARWAPIDTGSAIAAGRVERLSIEPAGAAAAIAERLAAGESSR
jgi:UDP-N-acetylglucosamine 2-epimerase